MLTAVWSSTPCTDAMTHSHIPSRDFLKLEQPHAGALQ
ncbi:rCG32398, isoform CRA_b [Rattus norvegicus]|uniref:RCG32398, isoform CRA_b n=1 Tax=Rattus norvegicus TaxID=10116 RepID=A6JX72_RAT|nr:rCG32398, isoform CRA_b [Rattus norvegicus]